MLWIINFVLNVNVLFVHKSLARNSSGVNQFSAITDIRHLNFWQALICLVENTIEIRVLMICCWNEMYTIWILWIKLYNRFNERNLCVLVCSLSFVCVCVCTFCIVALAYIQSFSLKSFSLCVCVCGLQQKTFIDRRVIKQPQKSTKFIWTSDLGYHKMQLTKWYCTLYYFQFQSNIYKPTNINK
jgi:hypothetical protein